MSQYLYRIQPVRPAMLTIGPTPEEREYISQHFAYLQQLLEQGVVILAGRTQNTDYSSFGIVIFNADSDAVAQQIVANDPAVKHKVMRAEWYPYRMALWRAANVQDA